MDKKLPFFVRLNLKNDPDNIFPIEEQDEVLLSLEYTTDYFPSEDKEDE